jgi:energy-coupling factor transporter transmembrane protein EcfT
MKPQNYPAAVAFVLNLVAGTLVASNFMSAHTADIVITAVVAATSLVVVFLVHPLVLAAATGAFQSFVVAVAAFGFHLSDHQLAFIVALFNFAAGVTTHAGVSPWSVARQGTTVRELEAAAAKAGHR